MTARLTRLVNHLALLGDNCLLLHGAMALSKADFFKKIFILLSIFYYLSLFFLSQ